MKKQLRYLILFMVLIIGLTCLSACQILITTEISSISFQTAEMLITKGEQKPLPLVVTPKSYSEGIYFTSSDENIVKISGSNIEGVNIGEAIVTATTKINKLNATIKIKVGYADLTSIDINYTGNLNQIYDSNKNPAEIIFTAVTNKNANPNLDFNWKITEKGTENTLKQITGKSIKYTMPNEVGKTYVATVVCENKTASIEFGLYTSMHNVALTPPSTAILGEISKLELIWPEGCSANPNIRWYIKIGENDTVEIESTQNAKTIDYIPQMHAKHTVFAIVDNVKSNEIEFTPAYNEIKEVSVNANKTIIKQGMAVFYTLQYNLKNIDPDSDVMLEIFANSENNATESVSELAKNFNVVNFNVTYDTIGEFTLFVKLNGVKSNVITINVKEDLPALGKIDLSTTDNLEQKGIFEPVTINAAGNPIGAYTDNIEWYINDEKTEITGDTFTFTPTSVGEHHIQAKSGYIESKYMTVVCTNNFSVINNYVNGYHCFGGYKQNYYITNQREMDNIVHYAIANRLYDSTKLRIYVDYDKNINVLDKIKTACDRYAESGYLPGYSYTNSNYGEIDINFKYESATALNPTQSTSGSKALPQNTKVIPHYANNTGSTRELYIDTVTETMDVVSTNMLYKAVQWGYKPVIKGDNATNISTVYSNAKSVLRKIINEEMTDYQKIHAIYDWLCYDIAYDYDLLDVEGELNNQMSYYGYYLEGIFLDKRAVCDGKAKAFVLMCGMEGINAVRIGGEINTSGHAWNKVLLDADGDNEMEWYVVDSTWGDISVNNKEILSHCYFLLNDAEINSTHTEKENPYYPTAVNNFSYYQTEGFSYSSIFESYTGDCYINNKEELEYLFKYAKQQGWTSVEFYLAYDYDGTQNNLISSAANKANYSTSGYVPIGNDKYGNDKRAIVVLAA